MDRFGKKRAHARITARALALHLGWFLLGNAFLRTLPGSLDPARILFPWFDWMPELVRTLLGLALGGFLLAWALVPDAGRLRRRVTAALLLLHAVPVFVALLDDLADLYQGRLQLAFLPGSLVVLASLTFLGLHLGRTERADKLQTIRLVLTAFLFALLHPLFLAYAYGSRTTNAQADLAVVFGSRVYRDGTCSTSVGDRVRTAAELYREGRVAHLLMSGGPGDGAIHETEGMKRLAISLGVPPERISTDLNGVDTRATVTNTLDAQRRLGTDSLVAVSHFYHLPRIELEFARHGAVVETYPAIESRSLARMPFFVAREIPAYWYYWLTFRFGDL